jgi:hypothetical protein
MAMRTTKLVLGVLLVGLLAISSPAFAHHTWRGYDMANLTTVKGIVTQFDWANPHVWMSLDVKDDKGNVEKWRAGGPSPSRMGNAGWEKDTLKPGDQIVATGNRNNDGSYEMRLVKVMVPDGRELICYGGR